MKCIDLNCDMGEGMANDAALLNLVSSANIACGFHAGDLQTMRATAALAHEKEVAIGAHPSFRDRETFGRSASKVAPKEIFGIVCEQINNLKEICAGLGAKLHHVKPHGALYNQAARDEEISAAIAEAILEIDPQLFFYGLSGSEMISAARKSGLKTTSEVFADRTYQADGTLTPRTRPNALIEDVGEARAQVLQMINEGFVIATGGERVAISAETICIHGDGAHASEFAKAIRTMLIASGIEIKAP
jgi:UPF0271 protein